MTPLDATGVAKQESQDGRPRQPTRMGLGSSGCDHSIYMPCAVRLLDLPLERDEGEYAYAGQLIFCTASHPDELAYNMKFPGSYAVYAAIMALFGQTTAAIHIGLLLVNAATIVLIFLLGRRLLGYFGGTAAAVSYRWMSLGCGVLGWPRITTHFVVLPMVGGLLLCCAPAPAGASGQLRQRTVFWTGAPDETARSYFCGIRPRLAGLEWAPATRFRKIQ